LPLEKLGIPAEKSLKVEASHNGLLAVFAAGVRCIVTRSYYTWKEQMDEVMIVVADL
jgi:beta-phosphoglucomutase-like phosphatase (HAD superfamily)